jgi:hypothetical protein
MSTAKLYSSLVSGEQIGVRVYAMLLEEFERTECFHFLA